MALTNRKNRGQQTFQPSFGGLTLNIPAALSILRGKIILVGTVTIAGGTTSGVPVGDGGPLNLIKFVRLAANPAGASKIQPNIYPGGDIVFASPRSLLRKQEMLSKKLIIEQSGSVLGSGAAGVYPIYLEIPISFADHKLKNMAATALPTDESIYSSLQLQLDTGCGTDCFVGNDRAWTYNLQIQWWDSRVDIVPAASPFILFQEDHLLQIGAANSRLNDPGLQNTGDYVRWLVMAEEGASQVLSDAILNRIRVDSPTWQLDEYERDTRADMYDENWIDASMNAAGLYLWDHTEGIIANRNPAPGMQLWFDVENPSGAFLDQLRIFTERVYQPVAGN